MTTIDDMLLEVAGLAEHVSTRGCSDFGGACVRALRLEDGEEKERELLQVAAEAVFYAHSLRAEREG